MCGWEVNSIRSLHFSSGPKKMMATWKAMELRPSLRRRNRKLRHPREWVWNVSHDRSWKVGGQIARIQLLTLRKYGQPKLGWIWLPSNASNHDKLTKSNAAASRIRGRRRRIHQEPLDTKQQRGEEVKRVACCFLLFNSYNSARF